MTIWHSLQFQGLGMHHLLMTVIFFKIMRKIFIFYELVFISSSMTREPSLSLTTFSPISTSTSCPCLRPLCLNAHGAPVRHLRVGPLPGEGNLPVRMRVCSGQLYGDIRISARLKAGKSRVPGARTVDCCLLSPSSTLPFVLTSPKLFCGESDTDPRPL